MLSIGKIWKHSLTLVVMLKLNNCHLFKRPYQDGFVIMAVIFSTNIPAVQNAKQNPCDYTDLELSVSSLYYMCSSVWHLFGFDSAQNQNADKFHESLTEHCRLWISAVLPGEQCKRHVYYCGHPKALISFNYSAYRLGFITSTSAWNPVQPLF